MVDKINNVDTFLLNKFSLKKKSLYSKKIIKFIVNLKYILSKKCKKPSFLLNSSFFYMNQAKIKTRGLVINYSIHFLFSSANTFMYVIDSKGNLKFRSSAGLVGFKGKLKKSRFQVLSCFFKELIKLKFSILKDSPISLRFSNVGFYKSFITKRLKKFFFIRLIKSYSLYSYNGCRKKKKIRK